MIGRVLARTASARSALFTQQKRTVVHLPPSRRAPLAMKFAIGGTMVASSLVIPIWVMVNMKYYNGSINEPDEDAEDE